jgi:ketosteroid isomerase-like protein
MPRRWRLRRLLIDWAAWRSYNAFKRGDLELLRVIYHPDCIWDMTQSPVAEMFAQQAYRGHQGLAAFVTEWGDAWGEGAWPDLVSLEEFEGGVFLADQRIRATGRSSGVPVQTDFFAVAKLRDGLFWRLEYFADRAQAVEAARALSRQPTRIGPEPMMQGSGDTAQRR